MENNEFINQVIKKAYDIYRLTEDCIVDHHLLCNNKIEETKKSFTPESFVLWFGGKYNLRKKEDIKIKNPPYCNH